jgi:hypothetical protein
MDRGRCNGTSLNLTPNTETKTELALVQEAYCNRCPVRPECLHYALLYHESGYWGGTDTAERRALARDRSRVKCPVCKSKSVLRTDDHHQLCQACGLSWAGTQQSEGEAAVP